MDRPPRPRRCGHVRRMVRPDPGPSRAPGREPDARPQGGHPLPRHRRRRRRVDPRQPARGSLQRPDDLALRPEGPVAPRRDARRGPRPRRPRRGRVGPRDDPRLVPRPGRAQRHPRRAHRRRARSRPRRAARARERRRRHDPDPRHRRRHRGRDPRLRQHRRLPRPGRSRGRRGHPLRAALPRPATPPRPPPEDARAAVPRRLLDLAATPSRLRVGLGHALPRDGRQLDLHDVPALLPHRCRRRRRPRARRPRAHPALRRVPHRLRNRRRHLVRPDRPAQALRHRLGRRHVERGGPPRDRPDLVRGARRSGDPRHRLRRLPRRRLRAHHPGAPAGR